GQLRKYPLPHPGHRPAAEPPVGVFPVAKALRQVPPRDAGAIAIKNCFDKATVVLGGDPDMAGSPRQQVLDALPLVIAQSVPGYPGHGVSLLQSRLAMIHTNACEGRLFLLNILETSTRYSCNIVAN